MNSFNGDGTEISTPELAFGSLPLRLLHRSLLVDQVGPLTSWRFWHMETLRECRVLLNYPAATLTKTVYFIGQV